MPDNVVTGWPPHHTHTEFAFKIDFQSGVGPASRVFAATYDFIRACETFDAELVQSIDSTIKSVLVLDNIEAGSIKTWLRNELSAIDDEALKALDWKTIVGKYLVRAKYKIIKWLDNDASRHSLPTLREEILQIAIETDVRHLPAYVAPSPKSLIGAIRGFQSVKDRLIVGDKASFITQEGDLELNLSVSLPIEEIEALEIARTIAYPASEMILTVKKPDYLGSSKWELRHGNRTISAKIEDNIWLNRFQGRQENVRPGDALRCKVKIEMLYGFDNELITDRHTIVEVLEILSDRSNTLYLPFDSKLNFE